MGYKGNGLRGSIACVHPNIVYDLIGRVGEAEDYVPEPAPLPAAGLLRLGWSHSDDA